MRHGGPRKIGGGGSRGAILGLCLACALVLSGIAAHGAAAAGQTAYTCVKGASKDYATEHCKPGQTGSSFGQVAITEETHAELHNLKTNETTTGSTSSILKETIAATPLELIAAGVKGTGTLINKETSGVMEGTAEGTITYTGVTVAAPAGKGCKIFEDVQATKTEGTEGVVKTNAIKSKTVANGAIDEVEIEPASGTVFATFFITCTKGLGLPEALEGTWEVTGKIKCPTNGATILCNHTEITTQNTLKGKGAKAGFAGAVTVTAGKFPTTEPTNPVSFTTGEPKEPPPPIKGTTAFTCGPVAQPNSSPGFSKSHCKPSDAVGTNAAYAHTASPEGTSTEAIASNKNTGGSTESSTPMKLRATTSGIDTEIQASGVSGTGTLENMKAAGTEEHTISGSGTVTFTGVTVTKPEGNGCKVKGGEFKSKELKATTASQGDLVKFEAASGTLLASFEVESCTTTALNGLYEVKGTIKGTPEGATTSFTEEGTTIQNTMTMRGVPAGLDGVVTIAGRVKGSGSNYTDLSPTTVETE